MFTIFNIIFLRHQIKWLMSSTMLYIGKPTYRRNTIYFHSIYFLLKFIGWCIFKIFRNSKIHTPIKISRPYPYFIFLKFWKNFFIRNCIYIS